ncbi:hypothetical protein ACFVJ5_06930 [Nocardia sp. NPDC127606]|uniref:hypothetical protein n=1 Tax=Nocardia sp. NPDC127606 TaxID=3345406 RepID=UPI003633BD4C
MPVDGVNTGPVTESWIRYEKQVVALALLRMLLEAGDVEAIAVQHSSDLLVLHRDRRPRLVSIKHREPHQKSGDSGWGQSQFSKVLADLYRQWVEAQRACRPAFWSNAGFIGDLRRFHEQRMRGAAPPAKTLQWAIKTVAIPAADAAGFLHELELLDEPLPRRTEIEAVGAELAGQLLRHHGRHGHLLFARQCFDALTERVEELSAATPIPPADDARLEMIRNLYPVLDCGDAAALASRTLPVDEAQAIVLRAHDLRSASTVPDPGFGWEPDDRFVGRGGVLAQLIGLLQPGGVDPVSPVVLRGMTGSGKTSVAMQFAATHSDVVRPVFISAHSRAEVIVALQQLGADTRGGGAAEARTPVTGALPATTGLLLILDNVTDLDAVRGLIPRRSLCRVLITTTVANLDSGYQEIVLTSWSPQESTQFLRDHLPGSQPADCDRLREVLHDHPLALVQAVDHCRVTGRLVTDYVARLHEAPAHTLQLGQASGHPVSIIESIRLNIEAVHASDPDALMLLSVLSVLGPAPIHESVLGQPVGVAVVETPKPITGLSSRLGPWWSRLRGRPYTDPTAARLVASRAMAIRKHLHDSSLRDAAVEKLARLSLIGANAGYLSVHPLIALVVTDRIEQDPVPWIQAGVGLFVPEGSSLTAPIPVLDDNLSSAAHAAVGALSRGLEGAAPVFLAMRVCHRLMLIGPHAAALPHGWTAVDFGERAAAAAAANAARTATTMWKLAAARAQLVLAQAYSLSGRGADALHTTETVMDYGLEIGSPGVVIEAVATAEAIVTTHGGLEEAGHLLAMIGEFVDAEIPSDHAASVTVVQANLLRMLGRSAEAITVCRTAIDLVTAHPDTDPKLAMKAYAAASVIARDNRDDLASMKYALAVIAIQDSEDNAPSITPVAAIINLHAAADAAIGAGRYEQARALIDRAAQAVTEHGFGDGSLMRADNLITEGRLFLVEGRSEQARGCLEEGIAVVRAMPSGFRPRLSAPLVHLALTMSGLGMNEIALEHATEAFTIDSEIFEPGHREIQQDIHVINALKAHLGDVTDPEGGATHALLGLATVGGTAATIPSDGRIAVDVTQVLANIRYGLDKLDEDPFQEWSLTDLISEEEVAMMFYVGGFGAVMICETLDGVAALLAARFGEARASRGIHPDFDLNTAGSHQFHYTRESHDLAVELLNKVLADGEQITPRSAIFDNHEDQDLLAMTWMVVVFIYAFANAGMARGF